MKKPVALRIIGIIFFLLILISAAGFAWLVKDLPDLNKMELNLAIPSVRIVDRNDQLLYEVIPEESGRHSLVSFDQIPEELVQATIATEDRGYYHHPGVDLRGILRAVWINLREGGTLVGGSTITQQVARNLLMDAAERSERSLRRKLREILISLELNYTLSKDQVLLLYLNQTYYGGMAYGVEAASQTYFGKPVSELDLAECALLAGIPQAPALYNPFTNLAAARERQETVLRLMEEAGSITHEQYELAKLERLILAESPYPIEAPHFVMMVRNQLDGLFSQEEIFSHGGLIVRTSLDLNWQKKAENAVRRHLEALQHSEDGFGHNVNNAALVALDPQSGDILALVGSPDYFDNQHGGAINMTTSPRQPGSALKPLVYAVALDPSRNHASWTAATMLLDVRTAFLTQKGQAYIPENYDLKEHGPVLLREALASSLNIPAVIALDHIGLAALFDQAKKMGITTLNDPLVYDLSLALGGGEIRLLELTAAYGAFASRGYKVEPRMILEISDPQGVVLYVPHQVEKKRVLDARIAWLISDILSDNDARRIGFGLNSVLRLDRAAAVKTGTTSNFHDNWTIGYTPELVVGVWSGNTNYESMRGVNGLSGAAPIWHQFIRSVMTGRPESSFSQPPGFIKREICSLSGLIATEWCPFRRMEWFIQGTEPDSKDSFYKQVLLDAHTGKIANQNTPPSQLVPRIVLDLPPAAASWARSQHLLLWDDIQLVTSPDYAMNSPAQSVEIISPAQGSVFILSKGVPLQDQRILLEAVSGQQLSQLVFFLDGNKMAQFENGPYKFWWSLQPGEHQLWVECVTLDGQTINSDPITFFVR